MIEGRIKAMRMDYMNECPTILTQSKWNYDKSLPHFLHKKERK